MQEVPGGDAFGALLPEQRIPAQRLDRFVPLVVIGKGLPERFGQSLGSCLQQFLLRNAIRRQPREHAQQIVGRGGFPGHGVEREAERRSHGIGIIVAFGYPLQLVCPDAPVLGERHPVAREHIRRCVLQRQHQTIQIPRQPFRRGLVVLPRALQQEPHGFRDAPLGDTHGLGEAVPVFVARGDEHVAVPAEPLHPRAQRFGRFGVIEDGEPVPPCGDLVDDAQCHGPLILFRRPAQQTRDRREAGQQRRFVFGFDPDAEPIALAAEFGELPGHLRFADAGQAVKGGERGDGAVAERGVDLGDQFRAVLEVFGGAGKAPDGFGLNLPIEPRVEF